MPKIVCDTSFLMHMATHRIRNIDRLDTEIGEITFVVPQVVRNELARLAEDPSKRDAALATMEHISKMEVMSMCGEFADRRLLEYSLRPGAVIATMDRSLKGKIKRLGGTVVSISHDSIVMES